MEVENERLRMMVIPAIMTLECPLLPQILQHFPQDHCLLLVKSSDRDQTFLDALWLCHVYWKH